MNKLQSAIEYLASIIANDPTIGRDEIDQILLDVKRRSEEIKQSQDQKE